jgi:hypothetical protein
MKDHVVREVGLATKPAKQRSMPWDRADEPGPDKTLDLASDDFDLTSLPPGCVAIRLANGGYALVDEEDECRVDEYNWYKVKNKRSHTWYCGTHIGYKDSEKHLWMHRHLFGLSKGDRVEVDHVNHNGLDNRRKANLRLASRSQNMANSRKIGKATSKYRGVGWNKRVNKWCVRINRYINNTNKAFHLGFFEVEAEAAYAYAVAATLLYDPDFLKLEAIPPEGLPGEERLEEIRRTAIARVKAALAGVKCAINSSSSYNGVFYNEKTEKWLPSIFCNKKHVYLGCYDSEVEAAYAYDCAVRIRKLTDRRENGIERDNLKTPGRSDEIDADVAVRVEASRTGGKPFTSKVTSGYRGVGRTKSKSNPWSASLGTAKMYWLGAAIAYNAAISFLGIPGLIPNTVPPESLPSRSIIDKIEVRIISRLAGRPS